MTAEVLRRAASELREDARLFDNRDSDFCIAVADWLDNAATRNDNHVRARIEMAQIAQGAGHDLIAGPPPDVDQFALAVANAYLGGAS